MGIRAIAVPLDIKFLKMSYLIVITGFRNEQRKINENSNDYNNVYCDEYATNMYLVFPKKAVWAGYGTSLFCNQVFVLLYQVPLRFFADDRLFSLTHR